MSLLWNAIVCSLWWQDRPQIQQGIVLKYFWNILVPNHEYSMKCVGCNREKRLCKFVPVFAFFGNPFVIFEKTVLAAWGTDGRGFEPRTSTNACRHVFKYMDRKGSAAMLTPIQSAGVTPEVNLRITQVRKHTKDPPWFWNPGQTSPEVQNRGISGPTKRTYVLQKLKKKKNL